MRTRIKYSTKRMSAEYIVSSPMAANTIIVVVATRYIPTSLRIDPGVSYISTLDLMMVVATTIVVTNYCHVLLIRVLLHTGIRYCS